MFFPAADTIAFSDGGVEAMRLDSAGNMGLGTASPTVYVANDKVFQIGSGANGGAIRISNTTTGANGGLLNYQLGLNSYLYNTSAGFLAFGASNAEAMRITSAGNVGIGTSSPAQRLAVSNAGAEGMEIIPAVNANENRIQSFNRSTALWNKFSINCSTYELFVNGGTSAMFADTSGNVGIGTSSPASKLNVAGGNITVSAGNGITWSGDQNRIMTPEDNVSGALVRWASGGIARFLNGSTETLRLTGSGAVVLQGGATNPGGIGITFPATQSASSNANTLDDYEEGTFSPTISGWSGTYTTQKGFYTKVGRLVTLIGQVSTVAGTGTFTDFPGPANYPFAAGGYAGSYYNGTWAVTSGAQALPTGWLTAGPLDGPMNGNTSSFPNVFVANGTVSNWTNAQCNPAVIYEIRFQVIYYT
jgi:hypothetical protein